MPERVRSIPFADIVYLGNPRRIFPGMENICRVMCIPRERILAVNKTET